MSKKKDAKQRLTRMLDLPADAIADLPRMRYDGAGDLYIENHKGIVEYNCQCLRLALGAGGLRVCGCDLELDHTGADSLRVRGQIKAIEFI